MIRALLLFLVGATLSLRASEPISIPYTGGTAKVTQPHVVADMIPESNLVKAETPFRIILHLHMDPGWHTYWINPGDAGLATKINWTLPEGFTAGPIQWPTPEKHSMGPLVTYGYEGDVYLITTIMPPKSKVGPVSQLKEIEIKAKASWLVCQEECIPGKGEFSMGLEYRNLFDSSGNGGPSVLFERTSVDNAKFFDAAGMRLPVPNKGWDVSGTYVTDNGKQALDVSFTNKFGHDEKDLGELQFFPEQGNVLDPQASPVMLPQKNANSFSIRIPLIQNGEKVDKISGVLTSTVPLVSEKTGDNHAVYIAEFPVTAADGIVVDKEVSQAVDTNAGKASVAGDSDGYRGGAPGDAGATAPPMETSAATSEIQPLLIVVLASAFIGGLILNLMPCVLPVLSLKVFSLIKHAGDHPKQVWQQGAAFTAGVVLSFWVLAGILLAFKAASHQLGWGFQMQSPGFVLFLVYLFFLLGLNLLGVFELGASLVGIDAKASGQAGGLFSSFLNGALATLAATPCTAPFMGSALGFAAQQSNFVSMLVFTFVALGMAAPYMLLTMFPAALKFVPKPGAWMEAFKQFMGFLLLATVVWLADVFTALVGPEAMFFLLYVLLLLACAAWAYGRWQKGALLGKGNAFEILAAVVGFALAIYFGSVMTTWKPAPMLAGPDAVDAEGWRVWSQDAVQKALADGKPVFVDFTAAWCLSCKVNERVALNVDSVRQAFKDKNVVLFKADWTHSDPEISKALRQYNRDGVPLYLLYSPKDPAKPQVLPEVLTPGIVMDALNRL